MMSSRTISPPGRNAKAPRNPKATEPPRPRRRRARRARKNTAVAAGPKAEWADWREGAYLDFAVVEAEIRRRLGDPRASWRDAICRCPRSAGALRGCNAGRWRQCPQYEAALAAGAAPPKGARPSAAQKRAAISEARTLCAAAFRNETSEVRTLLAQRRSTRAAQK
jgi:hypothetical protein